MPDLEPITREEKLLDGEDLTPITRKEMFIKRIYDKTQEIPEPITREEMFLKKAGEGGGDVTIEQLNVTENGTYSEEGKAFSPVIVEVPQPTMTKLTATENRTYTAPSGTAYNEVDVDVPLPSNAYLLKELSNLPQPIASFNDGADAVMQSLKVGIEPLQDLHGYDSPWAGGAGKNKFDQDTVYASYKQSDGGFRITGNTATVIYNAIPQSLVNTEITVSAYIDCSKEASPNGVRIACHVNGSERESSRVESGEKKKVSLTFTPTSTDDYWYLTYGNTGANYFYFKECQLELGSSATTYEPYSNECPISGWTEAEVSVCGVNVWDEEWVNGYYNQGQFVFAQDTICCKNKISVKPNTNMYYVKGFDTVSNF